MIVDWGQYAGGRRVGGTDDLGDALLHCHDDGEFVWLGMHDPDAVELHAMQRKFGLHDLAVEDVAAGKQRPKLEVYGDTVFVVAKPATYVDSREVVELGEIHLFLGEHFVLAVRHGQASPLHGARKQLEGRPELLAHGPGAVLHAVLDRVVDDYLPVIRGLQNDIDEIERVVFASATDGEEPAGSPRGMTPVQRIYELKREVLDFHHAAASLLDPLDQLARDKVPYVHVGLQEYFRDVADHLIRYVERLEAFSDLLSNVLTAHLTEVAIQQNNDMRKISAWVAIAAVPTMIAGVYGMNFDVMPELRQTWGYPAAVALMVGVCVLLYRAFKRNDWL